MTCKDMPSKRRIYLLHKFKANARALLLAHVNFLKLHGLGCFELPQFNRQFMLFAYISSLLLLDVQIKFKIYESFAFVSDHPFLTMDL